MEDKTSPRNGVSNTLLPKLLKSSTNSIHEPSNGPNAIILNLKGWTLGAADDSETCLAALRVRPLEPRLAVEGGRNKKGKRRGGVGELHVSCRLKLDFQGNVWGGSWGPVRMYL